MAATQKAHVLFLSPGNAVRSILAEYFMNSERIGGGRFKAFSAGSQPTGIVHPHVSQVLKDYYKIDAREARSKSWDEFRNMHFDMIISVCDRAKEAIPFFLDSLRLLSGISLTLGTILEATWIYSSRSRKWRSKSKRVYSSSVPFHWKNSATYGRPLSCPGNRRVVLHFV
jgi:protein-tyrosine-phosphatase